MNPSKELSKDLPTIIYRPESRLRHPLQLFKEMWQELLNSRELAWQLLIRDISAQYRQSLLGILWAFIPPVVTAVGLTFLKEARILNIGQTNIPYPVYVLFSMTLWGTFTDALNGAMSCVRKAKGMLAKIRVPSEAFILANLGQIGVNFGIQVVLVALLFIWFHVEVSWTVILAPVALIHLVMFGTGVGLILGPLAALYSDVSRSVGFIIRFWIFVTPVLYPIPKQGLWATLVKLNPVTPLLVTVRELTTTGVVTQPVGFWVASLIALIVLLVGWIWYRLAMPFIVERASMS